MTQNKSIHRATAVVPDKDSSVIGPNEAKDALNMRIGNYNPATGSIGIYKVLGNQEVLNTLLPAGDNRAIGWKDNDANNTLVFAVYNSNGDHAIYQYNTLYRTFKTIISGPILAFEPYAEVDMDIRGDILIWTDNINEPRTINMDRAIKGEYGPTITDWMIAQLHRPSPYPLQVLPNPVDATSQSNKSVIYYATDSDKPIPNTPLQGYQFAWNYEYFDNIESRISDPSIVNWNNGVYLIVPDSERDNYLNIGGNPNPYIVAIKFYYRVGNGGEWVLFKRVKNIASNYDTPANYGSKTLFTLLGNLEEIASIGGVSAAALNLVDGIGKRVKTNLFADNRIIHASITEGYSIELPSATTALIRPGIDISTVKWRMFPPVNGQTYDFALAFYDDRGRFIGGRPVNSVAMTPAQISYWMVNTRDVYADGGGGSFNMKALPWNQVVDWFYDKYGTGHPNSRSDLYDCKVVSVTPDINPIAPEINTVKLLAKKHKDYSSFLRTQSRIFYVYKVDGAFSIWLSNTLGNTFNNDGKDYTFYGVAFQLASGEPINFSAEQNYYIQEIGSLYTSRNSGAYEATLTQGIDYKITDQDGSFLISKQSYFNFSPNTTWSRKDIDGFTNQGQYEHYISDIILYSKNISKPITWEVVSDVVWTNAEFASGLVKYYYGEAYATGAGAAGNVFSGGTPAVKSAQYTGNYNIGTMTWGGFFSCMNINGMFNETWDSDTGNAVALDEEPVETRLINTLRHSEQGISNTKINNIFAFNPANEETVPSSLGPITKTIALATDAATGENLHVVCKLGTTAMFLSRTLVQDNSGNSTLATSSRVFGSKNTYQQKNGASLLRDVIRTDKGIAFFWDSTKKSFMQVSNNGLDNVSEQRFFQSDSWRFSQGDDSFVGYDPFFKEINVVQSKGEGLSYNFKFDIYQGRRTFIDTELFANTGTKAFSFMKGRLFILGDNSQTLMNEVGYPASIKFVCNAQITENKDFQWVHYKNRTGLKWVFKLDSDNGFTSDLQVSEFVNRKDYFEASIKRASNTLGGKYNGQFMDGAFLTFELSDFDNDQKDITFVEIGYSNSITNG